MTPPTASRRGSTHCAYCDCNALLQRDLLVLTLLLFPPFPLPVCSTQQWETPAPWNPLYDAHRHTTKLVPRSKVVVAAPPSSYMSMVPIAEPTVAAAVASLDAQTAASAADGAQSLPADSSTAAAEGTAASAKPVSPKRQVVEAILKTVPPSASWNEGVVLLKASGAAAGLDDEEDEDEEDAQSATKAANATAAKASSKPAQTMSATRWEPLRPNSRQSLFDR